MNLWKGVGVARLSQKYKVVPTPGILGSLIDSRHYISFYLKIWIQVDERF